MRYQHRVIGLVVELGQPPTNPDGRAAWLRGAQAIEHYRAAYGVCDRDEAFGVWHGLDGGAAPGSETSTGPTHSWTTYGGPSPTLWPVNCMACQCPGRTMAWMTDGRRDVPLPPPRRSRRIEPTTVLQHRVRAQNRFTNDLPAALMFTARYSCKWRVLGRQAPVPQRDKAVSRGP
jgi:hypothetical protein